MNDFAGSLIVSWTHSTPMTRYLTVVDAEYLHASVITVAAPKPRSPGTDAAARGEPGVAHGRFKIVLRSVLTVAACRGCDVVSRSGIGSADLIMR